MILNYNNMQYEVIAKLKTEKLIQYIVYEDLGYIGLYNKEEGMIEESVFVYGYQVDDNTISEFKNINRDMYYRIYCGDYLSEEDKRICKNILELIQRNCLKVKKEIRKDYYKYKIQRGELKLWKDKFRNLIYEIQKDEYYIDNKEFDIFYKVDEKGDYTFEIFDK